MIIYNKGGTQTSVARLTDVGGVGELGEEVVGISRHFGADNVELKPSKLARCVDLVDVIGAGLVDLTVQGEFSTLSLVLVKGRKLILLTLSTPVALRTSATESQT